MKFNKQAVCCMVTIFLLTVLTGCSHAGGSQVVNEIHFSLDGISEVTISYDEETITFFETESDELIIREYMTENKSSYYANVRRNGNSIHISEGGKPFFKDAFYRYIEVYLPASYRQALTVTTTDGNIDLSDLNLQLSMLRIDSTAGTVEINSASASDIHLSSTRGTLRLGKIMADNIQLQTTSGSVFCDELTGRVTYTSTSGNADIKSAIGSGSYKANNSGNLYVVYTEVTGNLYFFNKNDNISLMLPGDLDFKFEAAAKNGTVTTTFQECITVDGRTMYGTVGSNPQITIKVETNNGNIEVMQ